MHTCKYALSADHASGVAAPRADHVFLHVKAGMTVIAEDGSDWRMADVIWVDGGAEPPRSPPCFVADVNPGVINWINTGLLTHRSNGLITGILGAYEQGSHTDDPRRLERGNPIPAFCW